MVYSRVRPTRVWCTVCSRVGRNLESATTKEECTLESKSSLQSVAAPTPEVEEMQQFKAYTIYAQHCYRKRTNL